MTKSTSKTRMEVSLNEPEIEIGQFWVCFDSEGSIMRRLQVIAPYPNYLDDRWWVVEEFLSKMCKFPGELKKCPEFNLRYVFSLEKEND